MLDRVEGLLATHGVFDILDKFFKNGLKRQDIETVVINYEYF